MSAGQALGCAFSALVLVGVGLVVVGVGYDALQLVGPALGRSVPTFLPLAILGTVVLGLIRWGTRP